MHSGAGTFSINNGQIVFIISIFTRYTIYENELVD